MPETSPPTSPPTNALGGRYRLLAELGRGGMAVVHRARDLVLERDVAVKVLHPHLATDEVFLDRFRREAKAAASLNHPGIVSVFDVAVGEDDAWLVLELVDGPSLRDVLRTRGRLRPSEVLSLLAPVADALAVAHEAGLVHRDIKPENVLIAPDGTVKLTDFGLARAAATTSHTLGPDALLGSPQYVSPEAVQGQPVDARADVYALGILLFECLSGRTPFKGDTAAATALRHTQGGVPLLSTVVGGLGRPLDDVVRTATALDPHDRYPDAGAFVAALRDAVPQGPVAVDIRDGQHHTMVLPASGAADEVSPTQVVLRTDRADAGRDQGPPARRRRLRRGLAVLLVLAVLAGGGWIAYDRVIAPVTAVPNVVGETATAATAALAEAGFEVTVADERVFDVDVPANHVLAQEPSNRLRQGGTVLLTLSAGPTPVEIPTVVGEEEAVALRTLERLGLVAIVERVYDEDVPEGLVVSTSPEAGVGSFEGEAVTVNVSRGKQPIEVPNLVGTPEEDALSQLEELGLDGQVVERRFDGSVPEGHVVSQDPAAGQMRVRGDLVTLVISRGPERFPMPDVRGQKEKDARRLLEELGLEVRVEKVDTIFGFRRGVVDEQDPSPDTPVRKGQTVTLYVFE